MSTSFKIKAEKRDNAQKSIAKNLKKSGNVLATLYGRDKQYSLSVALRAFDKVFSEAGKHSIITLDINGIGEKEVLVKDYQIDGIKRIIDHVDFYEIDRTKKIKTSVALHVTGVPEGVRLGGGILEQVEHSIAIKTFPTSIPRKITVDVTELQVGHSLHISDIKFPEGVEAVGDKSKAIVTVVMVEEEATPQQKQQESAPAAAPAKAKA